MHVTSTDPLRALGQGHFHGIILSATIHAFNLVVLHSRLVRFAVFSIDQTVLLSQYLIDLTLWQISKLSIRLHPCGVLVDFAHELL